ncbi:ABC1 kinase family protein [Evansella clarkii]|uniref:ABC1 kinase family protein n=1 Tax=Evansella clarkii TaxID=79879 RepID=UPI000B4338FF|nr:AarF/UbiB family protein [Evansella clarkii]
MFEKRVRHLKRFREIAIAFSRYGFGFLVKEMGLDHLLSLPARVFKHDDKQKVHRKTRGERIRLFLEELGPAFVKVGQIASTRPDLLPDDILEELQKLQDTVPPFPFVDARNIIEAELGGRLEDFFIEFDEAPLGSASIGQVHYAVLNSGEQAAVKVQRPHIENRIKTDLEILKQAAILAELRLDWAAQYEISEIVEEISKAIITEMDYVTEGQNADKISAQFEKDRKIHIPEVYWDYTTKRVLTMEFIEGTKVNNLEELIAKGYDRKVLAERITNAVFHQVLIEGFFHGDPHPGNIFILPGETVVFMDFGMTGRLTPEMKANFAVLIISLMRQNTQGVIKAITKMGLVPDDVDLQVLTADVEDLREKYYDVPLSKVSLGDAVNDLFSVARKHRIKLPSDLTLLGKTLLTLEGVAEKLDPDISIVKIAEPFGRQLLKERYHPVTMAKRMFSEWNDFGEVLIDIPKNIQQITAVMKKGKVPVEITMPDLDMFLNKLNRISNRLSISIVILAFSIIMAGLVVATAIGGQSSVLWNIPAIEIGFGIAMLMFFWLLYSIFKSGKL